MNRILMLAIGLWAMSLAGCKEPSPWGRIPITGTAELEGAPFDGAISFRPTDGTSGPSTMTTVSNGKFQFDRESGPVPGTHLAILIPKGNINDRMTNRIDTKVTVPSEEPFELKLKFTRPEAEPEPPINRNQPEEGGIPK